MYDQICCNWSRLKPGFKVPAHRKTIPLITCYPHMDFFKVIFLVVNKARNGYVSLTRFLVY